MRFAGLRNLAVISTSMLAAGALIGGCGSSKPAFCSNVSELEQSVKALGNLNAQSGVSGLQSAVQKVDTSAKAVVSSAKSEFPTQTAAIEKSVTALDNTIKELSTSPTSQAAIAKLPGEVSAVDSAFTEFSSATKSKCS